MEDKDLELNQGLEEQPIEASKEGLTKGASKEGDEVSEPKVITEDDIAQRVADAEKGWQKRKDIEFHNYQNEIRELKQKSRDAELTAREKFEQESYGDVDGLKDFHESRRRHQDEVGRFEQEKADVQALAASLNVTQKANRAKELAAEYSIDVKELLKAETPEEMEKMAIKFGYDKLSEEAKTKPSVKVDSNVPSVAGIGWRDLSPDEKLKKGLSQK